MLPLPCLAGGRCRGCVGLAWAVSLFSVSRGLARPTPRSRANDKPPWCLRQWCVFVQFVDARNRF
eukprot:11211590-Lingulodinium_polyedra.AAC.1